MATKHTHPVIFGRKVAGCPRCLELLNGAAPVQWKGARARQLEQQQIKWIREHNCKQAGCGPVCTFGDW